MLPIAKGEYRILVVDDSSVMRSIIERTLVNMFNGIKIEIDTVEDGEAAFAMLRKKRYSLMLTDLNMPKLNGHSLVERIKNVDSLKEMPIIVITTESSKDTIKEMLSLGVNNYMIKFRPTTLAEKIKAVLESSSGVLLSINQEKLKIEYLIDAISDAFATYIKTNKDVDLVMLSKFVAFIKEDLAYNETVRKYVLDVE
jgi:two-component system, chemotaxis family, chemotaxis protein CheY